MNYTSIYQDAAQSIHWNNSSTTLHPFVYYYKQEDKLLHGNLIIISNCSTTSVAFIPVSITNYESVYTATVLQARWYLL